MSFKEEEIHQQFGWKPLGTHVLTLISEKIDFSKKDCVQKNTLPKQATSID